MILSRCKLFLWHQRLKWCESKPPTRKFRFNERRLYKVAVSPLRHLNRYAPPMISFKPSIIVSNSSSETVPIFFPKRCIESVRVWLIFTHDFFGSFGSESSNVNGKLALGCWLVKTTAITVPERSLKMFSQKYQRNRSFSCWLRCCLGKRHSVSLYRYR